MKEKDHSIEEYKEIMNVPREWLYIVPLSGVILTDAVNYEFKIKNVLLVSKEKIPRIRKRLKLHSRLSDIKIIEGQYGDGALYRRVGQ